MKKSAIVLLLALVSSMSMLWAVDEPTQSAVPSETSSTLNSERLDAIRRSVDQTVQTIEVSNDVEMYLSEDFKDEIVEEVRLSLIKDFELEEPFRQRGIFFDGMAHVTLLRGTDFVPGGTLAFGYRNGVTLYSLYTRFDYFLSPLGSETGRFATLEFSWENGLSFEYVITSQDWQEVKLAVDFGYYLQYIERSDEPSVFYLSHNGLMIRPTISVKANLLLFRIELGLYYQMGVYPRYEDYDGFGLYIKLF